MHPSPNESLRLEGVYKIYPMGTEKVYALNSVSMVLEKGDFVSILGPSGSGKSTLLHVIGLLDEPTHGKVYVDGIETSKMTEDERSHLRGRKIGFIFQSFHLIPSLTVLENVALPAMIYEADEQKANEKAHKVLVGLDMGNRIHHYPGQLSGGQRQRVAVARALINDPEIILADEPTGNLDSKTGEEVLRMLNDLQKQGRTVAIITHDPNVTSITERTIRLKDGKVVGETK